MAAKTIGKITIFKAWVTTQNDIVINGVHVIMARPTMHQAQGLELGHPMSQNGPEHFFEKLVLDVEIGAFGVIFRVGGDTCNKTFAFGAEIRPCWVYDHWAIG